MYIYIYLRCITRFDAVRLARVHVGENVERYRKAAFQRVFKIPSASVATAGKSQLFFYNSVYSVLKF